MLVSDFYKVLDDIAPFSSAEDWDNVGLLVGDMDAVVTRTLLALDATDSVVDEALSLGANLIITHHPVIFNPVRHITPDMILWRLIREGISVICAHTNLDMASGGVNDVLAGLLGLLNPRPMTDLGNGLTLGVVGELENPMNQDLFAVFAKEKLGISTVRYSSGGREIKTVAVYGGDGKDYLVDVAAKGAQAYVTGESKHNILLEAAAMGITYIEAGHFETESIVLEPLSVRLTELLPGAEIQVSRKKCIYYA